MLGALTGLVRTYTRAFLSQGVGVIGLLWCLSERLPIASVALAALVLVDQAIFLRGRWRAPERHAPLHVVVSGWCLLLSAVDLMLVGATLLRSLGVEDGTGHSVTDPLSCVAFALASFAHADLHLTARTGGGRIVVALGALLGDGALLAGVAVLLWRRSTVEQNRSR